MKKRGCIAAAMLFVFVLLTWGHAAEKEFEEIERRFEMLKGYMIPDGNFWLGRSSDQQICMIAGLMLGITTLTITAQDLVVVADGPTGNEKPHLWAKFFLKLMVHQYELNNITLRQLYDGVETFYKDYRNRNIELVNAIYIVRAEIRGEDPGYIKAQTRWLRKPRDQRDLRKLDTYKAKNGRKYTFFDHVPRGIR